MHYKESNKGQILIYMVIALSLKLPYFILFFTEGWLFFFFKLGSFFSMLAF